MKRVCVLSIEGKDFLLPDAIDPMSIIKIIQDMEPLKASYQDGTKYEVTGAPLAMGIEFLPATQVKMPEPEEIPEPAAPDPAQVIPKQDPF